jgi:DNA-binding GntR family transcriptional regulator
VIGTDRREALRRPATVPPVTSEGLPPAAEGVSLTERVYQALKQEIVDATLLPGQALAEPDLAERFGVSKTPVREALRLLVHEDLLLVLPRKGYVVRPLGFDEVREVFDLRVLLQPVVAARAARRRMPHDVARLRELTERWKAATGWHDRIAIGMEQNFLICEIAGDSRTTRWVTTLLQESLRFWLLAAGFAEQPWPAEKSEEAMTGTILAAIADGDAELAASETARYVGTLRSLVTTTLAGSDGVERVSPAGPTA